MHKYCSPPQKLGITFLLKLIILGTEKIRYPIVEQLNACTIGL
jgi:hypothetical protein